MEGTHEWLPFNQSKRNENTLNGEHITVLLVDDEEVLLKSLQRLLGLRGFKVLAANSGETALEIARNNPVDVAVIDVKMPGMGGDELMRILKDEYPEVGIIMVTGHGSFNFAEEEAEGKIHACLAKPCDLSTLIEIIKEAHAKTGS